MEGVDMTLARHDERRARAEASPLVGGLPDYPGIIAAIKISPELGSIIQSLADLLLKEKYGKSQLTRYEREFIATAVSSGNDCFYCMDTHASYAAALLSEAGHS